MWQHVLQDGKAEVWQVRQGPYGANMLSLPSLFMQRTVVNVLPHRLSRPSRSQLKRSHARGPPYFCPHAESPCVAGCCICDSMPAAARGHRLPHRSRLYRQGVHGARCCTTLLLLSFAFCVAPSGRPRYAARVKDATFVVHAHATKCMKYDTGGWGGGGGVDRTPAARVSIRARPNGATVSGGCR